MQGFRTLDPRGTGAVPRAMFEVVMRDVCQDSPARLEALGFAVPGVDENSGSAKRGVRTRGVWISWPAP